MRNVFSLLIIPMYGLNTDLKKNKNKKFKLKLCWKNKHTQKTFGLPDSHLLTINNPETREYIILLIISKAGLISFHYLLDTKKVQPQQGKNLVFLGGNWCSQILTLCTLAGIYTRENHNSCVHRAHAHVMVHIQLWVCEDGWVLECHLSLFEILLSVLLWRS